jgi:hypothetical protein
VSTSFKQYIIAPLFVVLEVFRDKVAVVGLVPSEKGSFKSTPISLKAALAHAYHFLF